MVEWKKLGNSCKRVTPPKKLGKELYGVNGDFPIIDQGQKDIIGYTDDESSLVPNDEYVLFGDHTRYVKFFKGRFAQGADGLKILKADADVLPRYFFYAFSNTEVPSRGYSRHWSIAKELLIPIPSLEEQNRIVGILDTFTASIDNLKEQIAQRRKQYEYYRDQLLDLEEKEGVEMKTIKDVCRKICSGGTPSTSKHEYYGGSIPWLRTQEVDWKEIYDTEIKITEEAIAHSSAKIIPANCVIVAMYGATAAKVAINKIPVSTNQACCNLEIDPQKALYKYVFHWLCKEYQNLKAMGEGSQNNINGQKVKDYPIPVPPLSEQQQIVDILDKFEASIQNLEAQLSQREKQYEYYRNKLLTFE